MVLLINTIVMVQENAVTVTAAVLYAISGKPLLVPLVTDVENVSIVMVRVSVLIVAVQGKDRR